LLGPSPFYDHLTLNQFCDLHRTSEGAFKHGNDRVHAFLELLDEAFIIFEQVIDDLLDNLGIGLAVDRGDVEELGDIE
jgi:hypothetical protein